MLTDDKVIKKSSLTMKVKKNCEILLVLLSADIFRRSDQLVHMLLRALYPSIYDYKYELNLCPIMLIIYCLYLQLDWYFP